MTTTHTPTTEWATSLCPPELRAEAQAIVAEALRRVLEEIRPTLVRGGEILGQFEEQARSVRETFVALSPGDAPDVFELVAELTGSGDLHDVLTDIQEAASPESNLLYAAVAMPGNLPVGVMLLIDSPDGPRRVSPMTEEQDERGVPTRRFRTFDYELRGEGRVISHDELIDGIKRAQAEGLGVDVDLAEANAEVDC